MKTHIVDRYRSIVAERVLMDLIRDLVLSSTADKKALLSTALVCLASVIRVNNHVFLSQIASQDG